MAVTERVWCRLEDNNTNGVVRVPVPDHWLTTVKVIRIRKVIFVPPAGLPPGQLWIRPTFSQTTQTWQYPASTTKTYGPLICGEGRPIEVIDNNNMGTKYQATLYLDVPRLVITCVISEDNGTTFSDRYRGNGDNYSTQYVRNVILEIEAA